MAVPRLNVNGLPGASNEEASATASPARGKEMRANLLSKLRAPPLVHVWDFWHDRQHRRAASPSLGPSANESKLSIEARETSPSHSKYEDRLAHLATVSDVRAFWSVFNNFDIGALPLRDSVHLFHRNVKPIWEDERNIRGGAWTFRVPKEKAPDFWKEICLLAIGEQLQSAVQSSRVTFVDDICGVSLSVRFTSILVQIWNRDAEHSDGVARILQTVLDNVSAPLRPKDTAYYYKPHREHSGFNNSGAPSKRPSEQPKTADGHPVAIKTLAGIGQQERDSAARSKEEGLTLPPNPDMSMSGSISGAIPRSRTDGKTRDPELVEDDHEAMIGDIQETLGTMKAAMNVMEERDGEI